MCKVSIIIPVYNVEKYLDDCIQSVLMQTLKDVEIICVNDGSTDKSGVILEKYKQTDSRFRIISQKNAGVSAARNTGIRAAKGEYILFLDSDDFLGKPESIERLYEKAKNDELDELFYGTNVVFENAEIKKANESYGIYYNRNQAYTDVLNGKDMFVLFSKNNDFKGNVCMQFFRRRFLIDNNLKFAEGLIHEDEIFTIQCISLAKRVAYLDEALFGRRMRPNSIMTSINYEKSILGYCNGVSILSRFAQENKLYMDVEFMEWYMKRLFILCTSATKLYKDLSEEKQREILSLFDLKEQVWIDIALCTTENLEKWKENVYNLKDKLEKQQVSIGVLREEKQRLEAENKQLETKEKQLEAKGKQLEKDKKQLEKEKKQLEKDKKRLEKEKKLLEEQLSKIINSRSYKIGRSITYVPRKLREISN